MAVQSRPITSNINEGKSNETNKQSKSNSPTKGSKNSKTRNSSGSSSVKNTTANGRVYIKIGEVFGRDKLNGNSNKTPTENKQKKCSKERMVGNKDRDDEVNLITEMTESERKQWVEDYLSHLPEYKKIAEPVFSDMKLQNEQEESDVDSIMLMYKPPSSTCTKSDLFNSPYIISNIVNFSKKNHSFNKYQTWKIRRENLKICEKLKSLENRKLSTDYYHPTIMKQKRFPNSKAINRTIENRRIFAENMVLRYMITKIKTTPNKKAPWYNPEIVRYIKT